MDKIDASTPPDELMEQIVDGWRSELEDFCGRHPVLNQIAETWARLDDDERRVRDLVRRTRMERPLAGRETLALLTEIRERMRDFFRQVRDDGSLFRREIPILLGDIQSRCGSVPAAQIVGGPYTTLESSAERLEEVTRRTRDMERTLAAAHRDYNKDGLSRMRAFVRENQEMVEITRLWGRIEDLEAHFEAFKSAADEKMRVLAQEVSTLQRLARQKSVPTADRERFAALIPLFDLKKWDKLQDSFVNLNARADECAAALAGGQQFREFSELRQTFPEAPDRCELEFAEYRFGAIPDKLKRLTRKMELFSKSVSKRFHQKEYGERLTDLTSVVRKDKI